MRHIDAHCHIWKLARGDYHWMNQTDSALMPIVRDFTLNDYTNAAKNQLPEKIVLVQAAATEAETEFLLSSSANSDLVGAVVGWVDLSKEDAIQTIEKYKLYPKFRGIRPVLQDIEDTDWLLNIPNPKFWNKIADLDICFDALIKPRHLNMITQFCLNNPRLKVVIDHAAKPQWSDESFDLDSYLLQMKEIGNKTQAYCKISGLLTELSPQQNTDASQYFEPIFHHLIKHFGPHRLMWGSDWPVVNLAADYSTWQGMSKSLLSELSESDQYAIFAYTAKRFYQINGEF